MRKCWEKRKLEDICEILDSQRKPITKSDRIIGSIPYYGATGIQGYVDDFIFNEELVLIGEDGAKWGHNEQSAYIIKGKSWVNNHAHVLRLRIGTLIGYLVYYLNYRDLNELISGAVIRKLTQASLRKIEIPLPPIQVQQNIFRELDTLNDIITKKKQQLEELDKLAQATYFNEFGDLKRNDKLWEFHLLKDVCTDIVDCPHSTPTKSLFPTNYPCIRTSELKKGQIVWKSMQYVCESEYDKRIARLKPRQGDIVYGREGSYGDAVCLPAGFDFCLGQRTMLLRPNSKIVDGVFLLYTLLNDFVYDQAKKKNSGSTVGHVNVADIIKFRIPLPPIEKQQKFVAYIATIKSQKANIQQSLTDTQQLFDYTMNKYFGS